MSTKTIGAKGFRLRKSGKQWLTYASTAGVTMAVLAAGGSVSADEVTTPASEPTTEASTAPTAGVPVTEATITNDTPTGLAANNLSEAAGTPTTGQTAFDESAGQVNGEVPVNIDHTELTTAAKEAEQAGVEVTQDPTSMAPTTSTAEDTEAARKSITAKEAEKAKELKSTASVYSQAVSQWTEQKNSVVAFNAELDKAHLQAVEGYNTFVKQLDEDSAAVASKFKDAIIKTTEKVQNTADGKTIEGYHAYLKELADTRTMNQKAIEAYVIKKEEYDKSRADNQRVTSENASLSASVEAENKRLSESAAAENTRRSQSVADENKRLSESADAENANRQSTADANKAQVEAARNSINAANKKVMEDAGLTWTGDYEKDSATVKAYNDGLGAGSSSSNDALFEAGRSRQEPLPTDPSTGYTASGSSYLYKGLSFTNGTRVAVTGNLSKNGSTFHIENPKGDIVTEVTWGNVALEGSGARAFNPASDSLWNNTNVYNFSSGNSNRFYEITAGQWYKIPRAATVLNQKGEKSQKDIYVRAYKDANGLDAAYQNDKIALWNANGAINAINGAASVPGNSSNVRLQISLDKPNNESDTTLWLQHIADIDGGQVLLPHETMFIMGVGGGLAANSAQRPASDPNLGFTYGKNMELGSALKGYDSAPDGAIIAVSVGMVDYTLQNNPNATATAVARGDFGLNGRVQAQIIVKNDPIQITPLPAAGGDPEKVTYNPVIGESVTYTPGQYNPKDVPSVLQEPTLELTKLTAPADPSFKEIPKEPNKPKVNYNLTALKENTPVEKLAQNEDGVDINNQTVAKGSTNLFLLNPKAMPAGRPITTSVVHSDHIAPGLELDIAAMQAQNKSYEISFDEGTRLLKVTANAEELAKANADRSSAYTPTSFKIIYRTLNDAATYTNTFRMDVNGGATGNVFVEYYVEGTNEHLGGAQDTEEAPVGDPYDTTDLKPKTISKNGKVYELVESHVEGDEEKGTVVDGDKVVKYFYKEVPPTPNKGSVIVHYVDEEGNTISNDEVDEKDKPVDDPYNTTDRIKEIPGYERVPAKTIGKEDGKITEGVTEVTYVYKRTKPKPTPGDGYTSYSNKVTIHTPGGKNNPNDPDNPNGKGNEKIQPLKNNTDKEGMNINNKTLLQAGMNYYVAEWDLDQYINDKSSKSAIAKGFGYIDNYQDDALSPVEKDFKAVDAKGNEVKGLVMHKLNSEKLSEAPQSVQDFIKGSGIDTTGFGDFYLWVAEDPQAFYDTYVKTGTDIFFNLPMQVKEGFKGDYTNQTYQIDFGNGYTGNIVKNDVPDLTPKKDVIVDGQSADGGVVAYGQEFKYLLSGAKLPGGRGESLWEYKYLDDYDERGDKFLGTYQVVATTDITVVRNLTLEEDAVYSHDVTLADGKVIKAGETIPKGTKLTITEVIEKGSDLTQYTTMEHDEAKGMITISFKEDFLKSVTNDSEFGADATIDMKRIAYGDFENTYINRINGVDYISNTVKTSTPAPVVPANPGTPVNPEAPAPSPEKVLPNTGESQAAGMTALGVLSSVLGLGLVARRRKEEE